MSGRGFAKRPRSADAWVGERAEEGLAMPRAGEPTARLTLDINPALRGRIKIAAFGQGRTMADLLRELLEQHFPEKDGL